MGELSAHRGGPRDFCFTPATATTFSPRRAERLRRVDDPHGGDARQEEQPATRSREGLLDGDPFGATAANAAYLELIDPWHGSIQNWTERRSSTGWAAMAQSNTLASCQPSPRHTSQRSRGSAKGPPRSASCRHNRTHISFAPAAAAPSRPSASFSRPLAWLAPPLPTRRRRPSPARRHRARSASALLPARSLPGWMNSRPEATWKPRALSPEP